MSQAQRTSALLPGARCGRHARPATGVCARCGDYLCGACGCRVEARLFCEGCAERVATGYSRRAVYALVFGMLAAVGLVFFAPVALVAASMELRAIRDGDAPLGGRGLSHVGLAFGLSGMAMAASLAAVWIALH